MDTRVLSKDRLDRLLAVGRGLVGELDTELVLDRLLETARELTGARYAALGILDDDRRELARFITRGVDEETHRAIGELPRGRGILGVLIDHAHPLRLDEIGDHPRSYGFPAGHPPMRTFLGVPLLIRGEAWGNLYLTEKEGGADFDEADEATVVVLADWAAVAIDNARLYETVRRRSEDLERAVRGFEATAAIAQAVGAETDLSRVLELVVKRARALVEARSVLILLREGDELVVAAGAGQVVRDEPARVPVEESTAGQVLADRRPRRVEERELRVPPSRIGVPDASDALLVPLVYRGRSLGVLAAFDRLSGPGSFSDDDEQVLVSFAASAATAVATARSVAADRLRQSIQAAEAERRRWARELHDETLQGLGGLKMLLSSALRGKDPDALRAVVRDAIDHVAGDIENLRAIITELRPAALDQLGLGPALRSLVERTAGVQGLEIDADVDLAFERGDQEHRLAPELATTVYRLVQESLTNVAKHADATRVEVDLAERDGELRLRVADDGVGVDLDAETTGFGLVGMQERVLLLGGRLEVRRGERGGTVVEAVLPALHE
ncbi:MAG TPA: GAF domain-containing sensor histidine kinase [Solirubrobacteraceae bacterium]|nr:GAF domain-containing sensor histidine kinase [Solirubrobacteraceae bacterium]